MRRAAVIAAGVLVAAVGVLLLSNIGVTERAVATEPAAVWSEVAWPFPMDQWGKGKAFTCKAADCGAEVTVYIRAKIGFCNCSTGVADDEELDRISDFDLFWGQATPKSPRRPIHGGGMKGRGRTFN